MNLGDMLLKLRRRIGNPSIADVTNDVLTENINSAYTEIADKFRFHLGRKICTFMTTSGVSRYGIPVDAAVILRARNNTSEIRLEKYDVPRRYAVTGYTGDNIQLGVPIKYQRFRDWIELIPIPDGVYEIELYYRYIIIELSAETDSPVIPAAWHEGILKLAKYYYYTDEGDIPKATTANNDYKTWLADKPVEIDEEAIDYDSAVSIPTLSEWRGGSSEQTRQDFNHSD